MHYSALFWGHLACELKWTAKAQTNMHALYATASAFALYKLLVHYLIVLTFWEKVTDIYQNIGSNFLVGTLQETFIFYFTCMLYSTWKLCVLTSAFHMS